MNFLGLITALLGFGAFLATMRWLKHRSSVHLSPIAWLLAIGMASPAALYVFYYSHLMGEPLWLYRVRAIPGSEVLAAFAGVLAGLMQIHLIPRLKLSPLGKKALIPVLLMLGLLLPHLKPVFRPLRADALKDEWKEGVCLQSSPATCGPASVATILRQLGHNVTERELAQEAFSSASGTENWYLVRAIQRRGLDAAFMKSNLVNAPLPAVAGVRLLYANGAGHFIAVLGRSSDVLTIADPLEGRQTATLQELEARYQFTGFFLTITPRKK